MSADLPDREMCPDCFMWIDDVHDPCPESEEGQALDESIREAEWEHAVVQGEAWAMAYGEEWKGTDER